MMRFLRFFHGGAAILVLAACGGDAPAPRMCAAPVGHYTATLTRTAGTCTPGDDPFVTAVELTAARARGEWVDLFRNPASDPAPEDMCTGTWSASEDGCIEHLDFTCNSVSDPARPAEERWQLAGTLAQPADIADGSELAGVLDLTAFARLGPTSDADPWMMVCSATFDAHLEHAP